MKFVVTAGPTREPIDPVRFISNRSSGKMGYAIAEAAIEAGHEVTLISGPTALAAPKNARVIKITTADELYDAVHEHAPNCDVLVMCAAVSDYKPIEALAQKLPKQRGEFSLRLTATRDILASLPNESRPYLVVGFAAETHDMEASALRKLRAKNCDLIVANDVSRADVGMESDENAVEIFCENGERKKISRTKKIFIAHELVKIIFQMREKRLTKKTW
ncbi:MAG: phosphopantothenoylcysteine decarboxylase domain-containing protein [Chthoniobacterales bacterium]